MTLHSLGSNHSSCFRNLKIRQMIHYLKMYAILYKRESDDYVEAKRKELGHVARVLVEEVSHFFESLLPTFKLVYEKLK